MIKTQFLYPWFSICVKLYVSLSVRVSPCLSMVQAYFFSVNLYLNFSHGTFSVYNLFYLNRFSYFLFELSSFPSIYPSLEISIYFSIYLSIFRNISLFFYLSIHLSKYLSIYLSMFFTSICL